MTGKLFRETENKNREQESRTRKLTLCTHARRHLWASGDLEQVVDRWNGCLMAWRAAVCHLCWHFLEWARVLWGDEIENKLRLKILGDNSGWIWHGRHLSMSSSIAVHLSGHVSVFINKLKPPHYVQIRTDCRCYLLHSVTTLCEFKPRGCLQNVNAHCLWCCM